MVTTHTAKSRREEERGRKEEGKGGRVVLSNWGQWGRGGKGEGQGGKFVFWASSYFSFSTLSTDVHYLHNVDKHRVDFYRTV